MSDVKKKNVLKTSDAQNASRTMALKMSVSKTSASKMNDAKMSSLKKNVLKGALKRSVSTMNACLTIL